MKQTAIEWSDDYEKGAKRDIAKRSYIAGYTQCQEDMADKKYTEQDMRQAIFTSFLLGVDRGNYSKELEDKLIEQFKK